MMILSVCPFAKYIFTLLDGVFTPKALLLARNGGNSKEPLQFVLKMFHFGLHFWPRVTLVTLLNFGNGGYLSWQFQLWG
jgi:hypothetical protein